MKRAGIERITLFIGNEYYTKFKKMVLHSLHCCELRAAVKNVKKHEMNLWLKHVPYGGRSTKRKWKVLDTKMTEEHIEKLLNPSQNNESDGDNDVDQIDIFSEE